MLDEIILVCAIVALIDTFRKTPQSKMMDKNYYLNITRYYNNITQADFFIRL